MGLSNSALQMDEGVDTFISLTILKYGFPRHSDGIRSVMEYADVHDGLFVYRTWLPYYAQALSISLFGKTTFGARFPFALTGIFSILSLYGLGFKITGKRSVGFTAGLLFASCVPALLYFRCARYIGFPVLFSVFITWTYLKVFENKRWSPWLFIVIGALYFHSMYVEFAGSMMGICLHLIFHRRYVLPKNLRIFWFAVIVLVVLTLPWILFISPVFAKVIETFQARGVGLEPSFLIYIKRFLSFIFQINIFVFPFVMIPVLWSRFLRPRLFHIQLLLFIILAIILSATLNSIPTQNYIFAAFPLIFLILGIIVMEGFPFGKWFRVSVLAILLGTNIFHVSPLYPVRWVADVLPQTVEASHYLRSAAASFKNTVKLDSLTYDYVYEISHPYKGTLDYVVEFFKRNGEAGELCFIDSEEVSFAFYTDMEVIQKYEMTTDLRPDWIVLRNNFLRNFERKTPARLKVARKIETILKEGRYQKIEIKAPIWRYNNAYDIRLHIFNASTIKIGDIVIYKLIKTAQFQ
tara:strand:+ start:78 stop:1643 length:1566 start_codon:yes stop_codon:yes gene_type:complete